MKVCREFAIRSGSRAMRKLFQYPTAPLLPACRQSARNLNASNANRKKNLVPGGVAGHETLGLLRIAFAGITSQHKVREDRSAALNDAVVPMAGDQLRWRFPSQLIFPRR